MTNVIFNIKKTKKLNGEYLYFCRIFGAHKFGGEFGYRLRLDYRDFSKTAKKSCQTTIDMAHLPVLLQYAQLGLVCCASEQDFQQHFTGPASM